MFHNAFFNKSTPFEHRLFMIFFFEVLMFAILSALNSIFISHSLVLIAAEWVCIIILAIYLLNTEEIRMRMQRPVLLILTFLFIPFLMYLSTGFEGPALVFALLGVFPLIVTFSGRERILIVGLNILLYIVLALAEYAFPTFFGYSASHLISLGYLILSICLSLCGLAIMITYAIKEFDEEKKQMIALTKQLEESNASLAEMTNKDGLTGTYVRRYLYEHLTREIEIAERTFQPFCLMMIDIDHFRKVNDAYGQQFGNEVLLEIASSIHSVLRIYDALVRYSGDRFAIILHNSQFASCLNIAERIKECLDAMPLEHQVHITASMGLTPYKNGDSIDTLISRAEDYLRRAKEEGRNRVVAGD